MFRHTLFRARSNAEVFERPMHPHGPPAVFMGLPCGPMGSDHHIFWAPSKGFRGSALDFSGGVSPNKPWPLHRASMEPFGPQDCPGNRHGDHCCPIEFHGPSSGAPNNLAGGPRVVDVPTETARVGPPICARSGPQEPPVEGPQKWDHEF